MRIRQNLAATNREHRERMVAFLVSLIANQLIYVALLIDTILFNNLMKQIHKYQK